MGAESTGARTPPYLLTSSTRHGRAVASNPALIDFGSRVAFCDLGGRQQHCTDSRHEFLGRNGAMSSPAGVRAFSEWSAHSRPGHDPCCAYAVTIELAPGASEDLLFVLGQAADAAHARARDRAIPSDRPERLMQEVQARWNKLLCAVQIRTPDRALDLLFNRWLLYQTAGVPPGGVPRSTNPAAPTASATSCRMSWR